ncbi:unnamed protein product [Pseudo-nitzschia multistriata]|uniref:Uncharacterized protein n=1 Tax=Pseudo-nitzschia multistriata TaxID=183589 RepID=A0A448YV23_9STRA|nr:unnamed protein product [Pseudo-nitzschia multistriata]
MYSLASSALMNERIASEASLASINENTNGKNLQLDLFVLVLSILWLRELRVDTESFFEKIVALGNTNESNILRIKVVQLINVT